MLTDPFCSTGAAPDSFIWADRNPVPSDDGFFLLEASPSKTCGDSPLMGAADGTQTYRVEFPDGTSIYDILGGSISVWCRTFAVSFGEVLVPTTLDGSFDGPNEPDLQCSSTDTSQEISLGNLPTLAHQVSGEVVILSEHVVEVRGFVYDGKSALLANLCAT
jgi:Electron transfer DM13